MHTLGHDPVFSLIPQPHERLTGSGGEWLVPGHPVSWWQSQGPNSPWHHVDLTLVWPHGKGLLAFRVALVGRNQVPGVLGFPEEQVFKKPVPPPPQPHLHSGSSGAAASPWMPWD